jgi:hypothetical protein
VWHSFPNSTIVGCRAPAAQALNKLRLENSRLSRQLAEATEEARLHASLKERVAAQDAEVAELAAQVSTALFEVLACTQDFIR